MNSNFDNVGQAFANHYYTTFDADRSQLAPLYRPDSMLTFEGQKFQGSQAIVEKLKTLPFQTVAHVVTTIDCQPLPSMGVLVFIIGQLKTDNDPPHGFSQSFVLFPDANNPQNYYVLNDVFRLALHHQ